jgi:hypothetical protein
MSNSVSLNPPLFSFRPYPEQIGNEGIVIRDINKIQIAIDIVNRRIGKLFPGTFITTEYGFKTKLYKKYSDYYVSQMNQKFNSTSNGVIVDSRIDKPKSTLVSKLFSLFS